MGDYFFLSGTYIESYYLIIGGFGVRSGIITLSGIFCNSYSDDLRSLRYKVLLVLEGDTYR